MGAMTIATSLVSGARRRGLPNGQRDCEAGVEEVTMANTANTVMLVDRSPSGRRLGEGLGQAGFRVTYAERFETARCLFEQQGPDFVVVEPWNESGAWDFIVDVRQGRPQTRVVVVTACASIPSAFALLALGVADYLAKPVTVVQVLRALDSPTAAGQASNDWMSIDDACGDYIQDVLHACGSVAKTARALGLDRRSLRRMLARRIPAGIAKTGSV
jgi:two-component system response regulator RegA